MNTYRYIYIKFYEMQFGVFSNFYGVCKYNFGKLNVRGVVLTEWYIFVSLVSYIVQRAIVLMCSSSHQLMHFLYISLYVKVPPIV